MRRMHTDQEIIALAGDNPIVKAAFDLATKTAETYKTAELVLNSSDFDAVFDAKTTPYETSDPEEPDVINALYNADIIIVYSAGASGTAKEDPHFFRKMRESNYEEKAYFKCFEMDTGKLYHYEMSVSVPEEGGEITITPTGMDTKPIYIHPILLQRSNVLNICLMIFNNSPAPFTTFSAVKDFIKGIATAEQTTARFPCTGAYYSESKLKIASHLFVAENALNELRIYYSLDDGTTAAASIESLTDVNVFDGVNKIN